MQPVAAAANVKAMGKDPPLFQGEGKKADTFMNEVEKYLMLNYDIAGFNSPKKKVTLVLTFMQGPEGYYSGSNRLMTRATQTMSGMSSCNDFMPDSPTPNQTPWLEKISPN